MGFMAVTLNAKKYRCPGVFEGYLLFLRQQESSVFFSPIFPLTQVTSMHITWAVIMKGEAK